MIETLSQFFADFGVTATFGAQTATVILDAPERIVADGIISAEYKIIYPKGALSGLQYKSAITVDGVNYTVNHVQDIDDGKITEAMLSRV